MGGGGGTTADDGGDLEQRPFGPLLWAKGLAYL